MHILPLLLLMSFFRENIRSVPLIDFASRRTESSVSSKHAKDSESSSHGVAAIVEPRKHPQLSLVLLNIAANLPKVGSHNAELLLCSSIILYLLVQNWYIIAFVSATNEVFLRSNTTLQPLFNTKKLRLFNLETNVATGDLWRRLQGKG